MDTSFECAHCGFSSSNNFKFCGQCGKRREVVELNKSPFEHKGLISLLLFFFISLVLLLMYQLTEDYVFSLFGDLLLISGLFAVLILSFAFYNGKQSFRFGMENLKLGKAVVLTLVLMVFAVAINFIADFLNTSLYEGFYFDEFALTYPLGTVILFQCVYPAFFEELAFRGFLIDNISDLSDEKTAIGVSAILFGIIHLSFVALIWIIPIGLLFGYLRVRYNTLWYGVIGHFFYNLMITLLERGVL